MTPLDSENEEKILKEVWEHITRAKVIQDLVEENKYSFLTESFEKGVKCTFSDDVDVLKISLDGCGPGFQVQLSDRLKNSACEHELKVVSSIVNTLFDGFVKNYFRTMGHVAGQGLDGQHSD